MITLEEIKEKIKITEDLLDIVKAMKALAASSIRRFHQANIGSEEYFHIVEMGLQIALKKKIFPTVKHPLEKKIGAIIFGSELGMCGRFNDLIVDFFLKSMEQDQKVSIENSKLLIIGEYIINIPKYPIEKKLSFPASLSGIHKVLVDSLIILEKWLLEEDIHHVVLFYNKHVSKTTYQPSMIEILPLNLKWLEKLEKTPWPSKVIPTFFTDSEQLFSSLVKHYLYISLYQGFVRSLVSENIARFAAMSISENHIKEHIEELNLLYHQQWQNYITEEILEIEEGYESLQVE